MDPLTSSMKSSGCHQWRRLQSARSISTYNPSSGTLWHTDQKGAWKIEMGGGGSSPMGSLQILQECLMAQHRQSNRLDYFVPNLYICQSIHPARINLSLVPKRNVKNRKGVYQYFQPVQPPKCPLYKQDPIDNTPPDRLSNFFSSKPQQLEIRIICPSVVRQKTTFTNTTKTLQSSLCFNFSSTVSPRWDCPNFFQNYTV